MNDKINGFSKDIEQTEKEKLKTIFPECFAEGKLDIDKLLNLCGEYIDNDYEKYKFEWKGKTDALKIAQMRSNGTLRPCEEESVNFDSTQNVYIEGDNLEVLKLLQTSYYRKVKMIYIDPPYNTGNDFIYNDSFSDSMENYKEITSQSTTSNPETAGRYHTNWLNMMYPRLRLAKNLLRDDGVIFISIDDNEVHNLRKLCDEVFGEDNFVTQIPWQSRQSIQNDTDVSINHEYILSYARSRRMENRRLKPSNYQEWNKKDSFVCFPLPLEKEKFDNPDNDPRGLWKSDPFDAPNIRPNLTYIIKNPNTGQEYLPPKGRCWRTDKTKFLELLKDNRIIFGKSGDSKPQLKVFYEEKKELGSIDNTWFSGEKVGTSTKGTKELQNIFNGISYFDTPKPTSLLKKLINLSGTHSNDLILDFFSGSSTTAHAVMQLNAEDGGNRKFIMVQLPELCDEKSEAYKAGYKNICEIGKERIRRAGIKITEESQQLELEQKQTLDIGFKVFKLDTSNLKTWDNTPVEDTLEIISRMRGMLDIIKHDRNDIDVVYEIMLKLGQELTETITSLTIDNKTIFAIGSDCRIMVCLAQNITVDTAKAILHYAPGRVVFAEQCFNNSTDKGNVRLTLQNNSITMKML